MESRLPPETHDSRQKRLSLSAHWWDESAVDAAFCQPGAAVNGRRSGSVLAVWDAERQAYLYPDFQFANGDVQRVMAEIIALIDDPSGSGWGKIEWLYGCHALLGGRRPVDVIAHRPDDVVSAAMADFGGHPDERW